MIYVLDTNVVSEPLKPTRNAACIEWLGQHGDSCFLTTVSLAELLFGIERLPHGKRRRELHQKVSFLHEDFADRILPFDEVAAAEFGRYVADYEGTLGTKAVDTADMRDLQIASIARANGWCVATRNIRHFPCVDTVNPFSS